ncbi:uncharacterized protein [Parasteatoda tepidariorum]|uniref:uncharacterized protein n=1 Tax=Parasteatoda tepidariorum TaxID=114398 RepID=UPI00077FA852|nr:uncharacterized protein LOC107439845 [Parasteatoda tepidariorum]
MGLYLLLIFSFQLLLTPVIISTPVIKENDSEQHQIPDKEVKELENLRTENQKPNEMPSVIQQDEAAVQPTQSQKSDNSRSAIFRHRGITQAKKNKYWNEKIPQVNGAGIQYSPADLAEYVFNTGDEEGVAVAVEELVREGMMGRTDAINYLQDVKQILSDMRKKITKQLFLNSLQEIKREVTTAHPAVIASTSEPKQPTVVSTTVKTEEDFKRPSYGFTLDVIYKLAKDMFTQSILRDDPTAEETLSGLVTFLENEVGNKRISPAMKEKVLEIVSAALVDSLREYQENQPFDHTGDVPMYHNRGIKGPEKNKPKSS